MQVHRQIILHSLNRSAWNVDFLLRTGFSFGYFTSPEFLADSQLWNLTTSYAVLAGTDLSRYQTQPVSSCAFESHQAGRRNEKVAVEPWHPLATFWREWETSFPPWKIIQIVLLKECFFFFLPPPMWCGFGGLAVRRPVKQVVLSNVSVVGLTLAIGVVLVFFFFFLFPRISLSNSTVSCQVSVIFLQPKKVQPLV